MARLSPTLDLERAHWAAGRLRVAGADEVGRGCLAGCLLTAAYLPSPTASSVAGVADSKILSARTRERLVGPLLAAGQVAYGAASAAEIDRLGMTVALGRAFRRALDRLAPLDAILLDGLPQHELADLPITAVVDGDATCYAIAAASILAKTLRDEGMSRLAQRHPGYAWERNAGYGTIAHLAGLAELGPTRHHRHSFASVRDLATT